MMIELMHTDLPEPVAPAMSTWGIFAEIRQHDVAGDVPAQRHRELALGLHKGAPSR